MFRMILTRSLTDMTDCYSVILDREYTVDEFIREVLVKNPNEWGTIKITQLQVIFGFGNSSCSYKDGHLNSCMSKYYLEQKIEKINANGGWGNMEYVITLK